MNILGLLDSPTSGQYELDGHNVAQLGENTLAEIRNKKIGFVFQSFNLLNRTTTLENVALPMIYSGVSIFERRRRAREALEKVGLGDKLSSMPNQLSGGQQQRVAIARALVTNPEVIFADEPTGALDIRSGRTVLDALRHAVDELGQTVVMVTHDPAAAARA